MLWDIPDNTPATNGAETMHEQLCRYNIFRKYDRLRGIFRDERSILTFCTSSLDAASPKIKAAPPKTIAVATANADPTAKKRKTEI